MSSTEYAIGIDVGASKIYMVVMDSRGDIKASKRIKLGRHKQDRSGNTVVARIAEALEELIKKSSVKAASIKSIGIGCAGQNDPVTGVVRYSPNLEWDEYPLKANLEKATGLSTEVLNDVQAGAWGEYCFGAGRGSSSMVAVFPGSGIGSGQVVNGRLNRGGAGCAGEVGHTFYRYGGLKCKCGQRGCVEAYAGGKGIELRARRHAAKHKGCKLLELAHGDPWKITVSTVEKAARMGDKGAEKIWNEALDALGTMAANYITLFNPEKFVLGGGIVDGIPSLVKHIRKFVDDHAVPTAAKNVKIVHAELKQSPVAIGAGIYSMQKKENR